MNAENNNRKISLRFALNYFMLFAVYGISSPYLQLILSRLGYSSASVGFFLGFFELVGVLGPMYIAQVADRSAKLKPFLYGSAILLLVGVCVLVIFHNPMITLLSLVMLSLGLKMPTLLLDSSLLRTIEHASTHGEKEPHYGFLRAIGSVGFVLIALLSQIVPGFQQSSPANIAVGMGGLGLLFLLSLGFLPETGEAHPRKEKIAFSFAWLDTTYIIGLGVIALGRMAMAPLGSFFSMYLTDELHWDAVGAMWALSAICEIPFIIFSWKFIQKKNPMIAIAISSGAIVVRLLIYALFPSPAGATIGQILHSLCYGLFQPAGIAFINLKTPPEYRNTGMAIYMALGMGLPTFLGSALGGTIVESLGYRWLFAGFTLFAVASLALFWKFKAQLTSVK